MNALQNFHAFKIQEFEKFRPQTVLDNLEGKKL